MGGRGNGRSGTASRYVVSRLLGEEYPALRIDNKSRQQVGFVRAVPDVMRVRVTGELTLGCLPGLGIDNGRVLAIMLHATMRDFADVDRIGEKRVNMATAERPVSPGLVVGGSVRAGPYAAADRPRALRGAA
jgi:hypothetical protein